MSEPSRSKLPGALTLILGLAGLGTFGTLALTKKLEPLAALLCTAVWEALVGLTSKIWGRVEKTVVELIGDWLDVPIRDFASGYRKRYLEHLIHRHRTFDVKGLSTQGIYSLEIEQVYVELTIDPRQVAEASSNPVPRVPLAGRSNIWTFLTSPQMQHHNFAILGAPGSGKTTLLKHITLALAARHEKGRGMKRTPILLFIRDHASAIGSKPDVSLIDIAR